MWPLFGSALGSEAFVLSHLLALLIIVYLIWERSRLRTAAVARVDVVAAGDTMDEAMRKLLEVADRMAEEIADHGRRVEESQARLVACSEGPTTPADDARRAVDDIKQSNELLRARLKRAEQHVSQQRRQIELLKSAAHTDALTGLLNRRALDHELSGRIQLARQHAAPFGLVLFDIDHFKRFNDTYGHPAGDALLRTLADTLRGLLRGGDVACRYGGEEFAVIVAADEPAALERTAELIRRTVRERAVQVQGVLHSVTVSVGCAAARGEESAGELIARSDMALYAAKNAGRDACWRHDGRTCVPVSGENGGLLAESDRAEQATLIDLQAICNELRSKVAQLHQEEAALTLRTELGAQPGMCEVTR